MKNETIVLMAVYWTLISNPVLGLQVLVRRKRAFGVDQEPETSSGYNWLKPVELVKKFAANSLNKVNEIAAKAHVHANAILNGLARMANVLSKVICDDTTDIIIIPTTRDPPTEKEYKQLKRKFAAERKLNRTLYRKKKEFEKKKRWIEMLKKGLEKEVEEEKAKENETRILKKIEYDGYRLRYLRWKNKQG